MILMLASYVYWDGNSFVEVVFMSALPRLMISFACAGFAMHHHRYLQIISDRGDEAVKQLWTNYEHEHIHVTIAERDAESVEETRHSDDGEHFDMLSSTVGRPRQPSAPERPVPNQEPSSNKEQSSASLPKLANSEVDIPVSMTEQQRVAPVGLEGVLCSKLESVEW